MNPPDLPGKTSVEPRRDGGLRAVPLPCSAYARAVTFLGMTQRLTPGTAALLVTAPLLWAGNAVVGRLVHTMIAPIALNFIRWLLAFAILLPLAHGVLRRDSSS